MKIQSRRASRAEARKQLLTTYGWSFQSADDGFDLLLHFSRHNNTRVVAVVLLAFFAFFLWQLISMARPGLRPLASGRLPAGSDWVPIGMAGMFLLFFVGGLLGPGRRAIAALLRGGRIVEFRYQGFTTADCLLISAPAELQVVNDRDGALLRAIQSGQTIEIARFGGSHPARRLAADLKARCPSFSLQPSE